MLQLAWVLCDMLFAHCEAAHGFSDPLAHPVSAAQLTIAALISVTSRVCCADGADLPAMSGS